MADFSQLIADVQAVIRENGRQLITGPVLQSSLIEIINTINADKQDTISDLDAIRAGALLGATAYQLPASGIPASDLAAGVQSAIWNASAHGEWAGQVAMFDDEGFFDGSGIDASEVATHAEVDAKYTKPAGGIPFEDLDHSVQVSLEKADNSIQPNMDYDGQIPVYNEDGYIEGSGITPDDLVQKDGTYQDLTAGAVLGAPVPAEFAFRGAPYGGSAVVDTVLGNSVKWNQLANEDQSEAIVPSGHIYYAYLNGTSSRGTSDGTPITANSGDIVCDLTAIFGAGNEPSTVSAFEAWVAQNGFAGLTDFNPGQVLGNAAKNLKTAGFNLWDEEWYANHTINDTTGVISENSNFSICKNFIPVCGGFDYYIHVGAFGGSSLVGAPIYQYDAEMNYIGKISTYASNPTFRTSQNCRYVLFKVINSEYGGNVYKNDICINISGPRNGQYEPYVGAIDTLHIGLDALQVKSHNIWDEVWESGEYSTSTGAKAPNPSCIRATNLNPCVPNTTYYFCWPNKAYNEAVLLFYDGNKNFITFTAGIVNGTFTTPANAAYFTWYGVDTTYNNDICINVSGSFNGLYEPYGTNGVIEIHGLHGLNGVQDWGKKSKLVRKFWEVDLGDLSYTSASTTESGKYRWTAPLPGIKKPSSGIAVFNGICAKYIAIGSAATYSANTGISAETNSEAITIYDEALATSTSTQVQTAMSGVKLVYEIATPVEYELVEPLPALYETADGGPEYIEGPAGTAPTTAPFAGEIRYSQPQADANGLAVAILDALKAASKISSYTFGIDPETSKPAITIS